MTAAYIQKNPHHYRAVLNTNHYGIGFESRKQLRKILAITELAKVSNYRTGIPVPKSVAAACFEFLIIRELR
jgi:hypothetical protein